ncbi:MAG: flagellar assembly protein T N-terminal domain-containing protein [Nitrospirae bacterium]|nr:flagellar assembly protein T N-terminal domain-containing protein [Nitrospirota bacterium]
MSRNRVFLLNILALFFSVFTTCFFTANSLSASSGEQIIAEGYATIVEGKKDIARDRAISDAFRRAIEQVVGVMVEAETVVNNFELLNDRIYSQTVGYIKNYKIIEEKIEGDTLKLKIEAVVAVSNLEKDLDAVGILIKKVGKPRLMLLISEQNIVGDKPLFWWSGEGISIGTVESVLTQKFMEKGFTLVDRQVILASMRDDPLLAKSLEANLSGDAALTLASMGEAEVVVIGQAVAKAGSPISGTTLRSCQANISSRVVNADNGETLASVSANAVNVNVDPVTGGTEAFKKAANEMADKLIVQVLAKWQKRIGGAHTIKIIVSGLDFGSMADFKKFLKENVRGIVEIYERSYKDGVAKLDVEVKGSAKETAEELSNKKFNARKIEVTSLTGNVIGIKFISTQMN